MQNYQDFFETLKQSFISIFLNLHDCTFKSSNSTIIEPTSDAYRPCSLLLNKGACLMIVATLIIVIILTPVVYHTHSHLKLPFKKWQELLTPTAHNLTWKKSLPYSTWTHFTIRLQAVKSEKSRQFFLFDWAGRENTPLKSPHYGCIQTTASRTLHLDPTSHPC